MSEKRIYSRSEALALEDRSDWRRVRALTDDQVETSMRDDPDWADLIDLDWSDAVLVVPRKKKAVSIRLDEDVLNFFKAQGVGYQTRMNAVLRRFMDVAGREKDEAAE